MLNKRLIRTAAVILTAAAAQGVFGAETSVPAAESQAGNAAAEGGYLLEAEESVGGLEKGSLPCNYHGERHLLLVSYDVFGFEHSLFSEKRQHDISLSLLSLCLLSPQVPLLARCCFWL